MIFKLDKWRHESCGKVEVGDVWDQTGVVLTDVSRVLPSNVRGLSVKPMRRGSEVWMLAAAPWRRFRHSRRRNPLVGMVMGRWT